MTWHETIQFIRTQPEYKDLVLKAYFHEDLQLNLVNYKQSEEYLAIKEIIKEFAPKAKTILDIGCGNGITTIAFALDGYNVIAVEPDTSDTVGANAIKKLVHLYNLEDKITILEAFAEDLILENYVIDVAFARQSMHHANNLNAFVNEMGRNLKKDGLFFTVRDHVIFDNKDKEWFLEMHPLQKFYHGENAFTPRQYKEAIKKAKLNLIKELKFYDSVINYFPLSLEELQNREKNFFPNIKEYLINKVGFLANLNFIVDLYIKLRRLNPLNEKNVPGRMYSYIAIKQ